MTVIRFVRTLSSLGSRRNLLILLFRRGLKWYILVFSRYELHGIFTL